MMSMNTTELRKNFHSLIDSIENEKLLISFYDLIKKRSTAKEGELWEKLTPEEQEELLNILEESQDPAYTITHDEMRKKYKKWL